MTQDRYEDPKAYQFELGYRVAVTRLRNNNQVPEAVVTDITNYVDGLLNALHVVNRAACADTYSGSEYRDERGGIYGTLLACGKLHQASSTYWTWWREEAHRITAIVQNPKYAGYGEVGDRLEDIVEHMANTIEDLKQRENDAYERGYAACLKDNNTGATQDTEDDDEPERSYHVYHVGDKAKVVWNDEGEIPLDSIVVVEATDPETKQIHAYEDDEESDFGTEIFDNEDLEPYDG